MRLEFPAMQQNPQHLFRARIPVQFLLRRQIVVLRFNHRQRLFRHRYLIEFGPDARRRGRRIDEAHRGQHRCLDARREIHRIKVKRRLHHTGVFRGPVRITGLAPVQVTVGVCTGRNTHQHRRDLLRPQTGQHQALLPAHAGAHQHDGLAVPVRPSHQVIERPRIAQVHVQKVRRFAVRIAHRRIVARRASSWVTRQFVVRIHIHHQPAFSRARRHRTRVQRIDACILQQQQCGELAFLRGPREIPLCMRSQRVQHERAHLNVGRFGLHRRQDGVQRNLCLRGKFAGPEGIEVRRPRGSQADLRRRDSRAHRVQPVVATCVAARKRGARSRCYGLNRHVNHLRLTATDFNMVRARREIQLALFQHLRIITANRPLIGVGWLNRARRNGPANRLAHVVNPAGMVRHERQLLRNWRALSGSQRNRKTSREGRA